MDDAPAAATHHVAAEATRYLEIRSYTERLAAALSPEDQCVQSMADASPAKWHRAHITWFFEELYSARSCQGIRYSILISASCSIRTMKRSAHGIRDQRADC